MGDERKIVEFPGGEPTAEEKERFLNEVARLSRFAVLERRWQMKRSAKRLGVPLQELQKFVNDAVKEREKQEAEETASGTTQGEATRLS